MHRFQLTVIAVPAALVVALSSGACGDSSEPPPPVVIPTPMPSPQPTPRPTPTPSPQPTANPSPQPTATPSPQPTATPSPQPTATPSPQPTATPSPQPTPSSPAPEQVSSADKVHAGAPAAAVTAGQEGDVIYYMPEQLPLIEGNAWLVLYRSTNALKNRIAVSGTVIVPKTAWTGKGPRPIVAFAHETVGVTDGCAPSTTITTSSLIANSYMEASHVSSLLAKGWAVTMTDYEGLGTPGNHTYSVNVSEARNVLDSVRAAVRLPGAGLDPKAPVAMWGYSQGGGAAAAAAEAAPTYAPEFDWRGVAAGGVNADLNGVADGNEGGAYYGFVAAASLGLDTAYPELDLEVYLNQQGKTMFNSFGTKEVCLLDLALGLDYVNHSTKDFCTSDPRQTAAWQKRLDENKVGKVKILMPALLYHGTNDDVIPYKVGTGLRDSWCTLGSTVAWKEYTILSLGDWLAHLSAQSTAAPDAVQWLADRFDGKPAPSDCK
jgi:pimeloyl-ACP methyl ester carboxylesterase